ncbi:MAG: hypothetical protein ACREBO_00605 [Novosphingobium sp.]
MKNRNNDRNLKQKRSKDSASHQPQQQGDILRQPGGEDRDRDYGSRQQGGSSDY